MEKESASRWWINCLKQFKLKTATRTRDQRGFERQGISPERDGPSIFVTPTLLGEEQLSVPNAPQSCCVAVSCPWLIAAPVERASACNAEQRLFPHTISGIVMSNQNAARPRGTLQPPHYSVRLAFILITARAYASLPEYRSAACR